MKFYFICAILISMIAKVIVDVSSSEIDKVFDYDIPVNINVEVGHRVCVPFGPKKIEGFVIAIEEDSSCEVSELKSISAIIDEQPVIKPEMIKLMEFLCKKNHLRKIDVLRLCLPSGLRGGKIKPKLLLAVRIARAEGSEAKVAKFINDATARQNNQVEVLNYLKDKESALLKDVAEIFPISAVNKLKTLGLIEVFEVAINRAPLYKVKADKDVQLTQLQQNAVDVINKSNGKVVLLFGVTGSGKTEVYMHSIDKAIKEGKSAIMLVPEISLTPQVLSNFKARFGNSVAILHSGLSAGERLDEWFKLLRGEACIAVGARSAIFAPLDNLGLIIIDEEHDTSYTSDSNPRYNTIDVAKFRCEYNNCPVVLGSATPSVESYYRAKSGEYNLVKMPIRVNNKKMPIMYNVNMYDVVMAGKFDVLSDFLVNKLHEVVNNKKQAILFLNRRGYAAFLRCTKCGYAPFCTDCSVALVYHKEDSALKCHYCDKRYKTITVCPECGCEDFRFGSMGTQMVVNALKKFFPNVPVFRLDNDTVKSKDSYSKILGQFENTSPSFLVGTQMVAKGHDFPLVTLVGIVDADMGLYQNDFRANERTFQLITQVAGRAGRGDYEGEVVLQTFKPNYYVYRYANNYDYEGYYTREIALRHTANFPPFCSIVRILFSSENNDACRGLTSLTYKKVLSVKDVYFSDFIFCKAVACPVKRIKTKWRYQIIMRIKNDHFDAIMEKLYDIVDNTKDKQVVVFVEINPQNLS